MAETVSSRELFGDEGVVSSKDLFGDSNPNKLWQMFEPYVGLAEGAASTITGMTALPIAGVAGLAKTITSGAEEGAKTIGEVADALTYKPKTESGISTQELIGKGFEIFLERPSKALGQIAYDVTDSPVAGTVAETAAVATIPIAFGGMRGKGKMQLKEIDPRLSPEDIALNRQRIGMELAEDFKPTIEGIKREIARKAAQIKLERELYQKPQMTERVNYPRNPKEIIEKPVEEVKPVEPVKQPIQSPEMPPVETKVAEGIVAPSVEPRQLLEDTFANPTPENINTLQELAERKGTKLYANPLSVVGETYTETVGKPLSKFISDKIPKSIKEFFKPASTLEEGNLYLFARSQAKGFIDRSETFTKKVFDKLDTLEEPAKRNVFQAVDGQIPIDDLPNAQQKFLAKQIIRTNDRIGKMLVNQGLLKEEQFKANEGKYVHYMYLKHVLGDDAPIKVGAGGKIDTSILKSRKDLTMEQRRAIGLIEDISVAETTGLAKALQDVGMSKLFNTVAENPKWTWQPGRIKVEGKTWSIGDLAKELDIQKRIAEKTQTPEVTERLQMLQAAMDTAQAESGNIPQGFVKIPESKSFGSLSGQFVRKEIADDLIPLRARIAQPEGLGGQTANFILDIGEKAMTAFKVGKTALNIPTATRNIGSNIVQLNMSGIPLYDLPIWMGKAAKQMYDSGQYYTLAKRNGLFKTNWAQGEIAEVMQAIRKVEGGKFNPIDLAGDLAKYYGKIDDFFKLTKFIEQMESGKGLQAAILESNKWGMDYSLASRSIKAARRFAMPFVSYQYKILPLLAETAIERPWIIAKYAAAPYILSEVSRRTLNLTDEDWKKLKAQLPLFIKKNSTYALLPYKSPEGNAQWVNIEYFLPWQNMLAIGRDVSQKNWGELTTDFGIGNPILDVYSVMKSMQGDKPPKDTFSGRPIYNQLDSPTEKALKTAEWVYEKWAPTMFTRHGALGTTARGVMGEKDRYGRQVTAGQAAGKWLGVNIVSPTPQQSAKERKALMYEARSSLSQILKDPTVSERKKQQARQNYIERIREIQKAD